MCLCNKTLTDNDENNKSNFCRKCCYKISYEELLVKLEGLRVLTTKNEWNLTNRINTTKIRIMCTNIECNEEFIAPINTLSFRSKECKLCRYKISYEELLIKLEGLNILTTKINWNLTTKTGEEKISFECTTIDCKNEIITKINTINLHSKKCTKCNNKMSYGNLINKFPDINILTTKFQWEKTSMIVKESINFECININCNNIVITKIRELKDHSKQCVECMKKISYEELTNMITDVKLITSEDDWNLTQKTKADKITIQCKNENCTNDRIVALTKLNNVTKLCMECVYKNTSNKMKLLTTDSNGNTRSPFHIYETELFDKLNVILSTQFILKKTNDGCKCDFYLKPINNISDEWLQVQMKTSKQNTCEQKFTFSL